MNRTYEQCSTLAVCNDSDLLRDVSRQAKIVEKAAQKREENVFVLHTQLGRCIGPLLEKYGAHAELLRGVLLLLRQLRLRIAHGSLNGKRFDELLEQLETATLKHTDDHTLAACATAWFSLMAQDDAPALHDAVQVRYRQLVSKLLAKARAPILALKKTDSMSLVSLLAEAEVGFRRLEHLTREKVQAVSQLNGVACHLTQLIATAAECMPALSTSATAPAAGRVGIRNDRKMSGSCAGVQHVTTSVAPASANCLASVLRMLARQFIFVAEELRTKLKSCVPFPSLRERRAMDLARETCDDNEIDVEQDISSTTVHSLHLSREATNAVRAFTAARKELLPALLRTAGLNRLPSLQMLAIELLCTVRS